jgi:hypothetical protein
MGCAFSAETGIAKLFLAHNRTVELPITLHHGAHSTPEICVWLEACGAPKRHRPVACTDSTPRLV